MNPNNQTPSELQTSSSLSRTTKIIVFCLAIVISLAILIFFVIGKEEFINIVSQQYEILVGQKNPKEKQLPTEDGISGQTNITDIDTGKIEDAAPISQNKIATNALLKSPLKCAKIPDTNRSDCGNASVNVLKPILPWIEKDYFSGDFTNRNKYISYFRADEDLAHKLIAYMVNLRDRIEGNGDGTIDEDDIDDFDPVYPVEVVLYTMELQGVGENIATQLITAYNDKSTSEIGRKRILETIVGLSSKQSANVLIEVIKFTDDQKLFISAARNLINPGMLRYREEQHIISAPYITSVLFELLDTESRKEKEKLNDPAYYPSMSLNFKIMYLGGFLRTKKDADDLVPNEFELITIAKGNSKVLLDGRIFAIQSLAINFPNNNTKEVLLGLTRDKNAEIANIAQMELSRM